MTVSVLLFAILVILLIAMAIWGIGYLPIPNPPKSILYALAVLVGVVLIAQKAGVF